MDNILDRLSVVLEERKNADPELSYVAQLHLAGLNKILEKVGEEATETIIAAKDAEKTGDNQDLVKETADLWFHTMVMLQALGVSTKDVLRELESRLGTSGLAEKQSRQS